MDPIDQLDSLAKRISSLIPEPIHATQKDIESNLRSGLETGLRKMNLVTREEFDVQTAVLQRTREKLEQLEKRVAALENNDSEWLVSVYPGLIPINLHLFRT